MEVEIDNGIDYLCANVAWDLPNNLVTQPVINLWKQGLTSVNRQEPVVSLSMWQFWATTSNLKWAVFVSNLSLSYHAYILKYIFTGRDDQFEYLEEATVHAHKMFTSFFCLWLKKVAYSVFSLSFSSAGKGQFLNGIF